MLQFVLGNAMANYFQWCIEDIADKLSKNKNQPIYVLVPEHIKFDAEKALLKGLKDKQGNLALYGNLDVNVYSFSRLAWALLKNTGVLSKTHLTATGQQMMVRYILTTNVDKLTYYKLESRKKGFIEQLTTLFSQFRRGNVDVETLEKFVTTTETKTLSQQARQKKMAELTWLYDAYLQHVQGQFLDTEDLYHQLANYIQTHDVSDVIIYLYGYERFNAVELQVVESLLRSAGQVYMTLPLDKHNIDAKRFQPLSYIPQQTYHRLVNFCRENRIPLVFDTEVLTGKERYTNDMQTVINFWQHAFSNQAITFEPTTQEALAIERFATTYEEVESVAKLIQYYVHEKGYRYNDFYVLMRQVEDYETLIEPIFKESYIPLFFDNATAMSTHPLIEFIASLDVIDNRYWQYTDIMRLLKTQLLPFVTLDDIDLLENELLANAYAGSWWFNQDEWENETVRQSILTCLVPFFETLKTAQTMKEAATMLFNFLLENSIPQTILSWRDYQISQGDLEKAKKQEQAWDTFVALLDELVLILGEQPFDRIVFFDVLVNGFEQAEFNLVPATLDQVSVASLDGKRLLPRKMVFIIGATPTQFPKAYDNRSLLSYDDVKRLEEHLPQQSYLDLSTAYRTRVEPFVVMNAWLSALEKVFVFSSVSEQEATYTQLLKKYLKNTQINLDDLVGVGKMAVRHVVKHHTETANNVLSQTVKQVVEQIENSPLLNNWYEFIKSSVTYNNLPQPLNNAKELYEGDLHLSITQLESYFADPFSHFLKYGLKLKERQTLELTTANIGNVFHFVLDGVHQILLKQGKQLRDLTIDELLDLTHSQLQVTFKLPENKVFERTKSLQFSKRLIEETLQQTLLELQQNNREVLLNTTHTELLFSSMYQNSGLVVPALSIADNRKLYLRGIIDRLDSNTNYFSVVDYKSSDRQFKLQQFYEGISLQLMLYLYVSTNHLKKDKSPIGAFYREVNFEYQIAKDETQNRELIKQKGLIVAPSHVLSEIDPNHTVYQVRVAKSGEYVKGQSHIFNSTQLPVLFDYLLMKVSQAGNRLLAGDIALYPIEDNSFIPSLNEYRSISLFDATNPTNNYRRFERLDDVFQRIQEKVGEKRA